VQFYGADSDTLKAASEALKTALAEFPEVSAVEDSLNYDKEELILELTPQGRALGFSIDALGRVLRHRLNGLEAATGSARINTSEGTRDVRLVAARFARDRIYRFLFLTPPEATARRSEDLRRTTYNLRRMTDAEAAAVKPLKVRVITVNRGDTADKLAALMPLEAFNIDWFRALNGMTPGDALTPGEKVKIVTP
jgi:predicted Zn-dependent protease